METASIYSFTVLERNMTYSIAAYHMFKELFIEGALLLRRLPRCHRPTERQSHAVGGTSNTRIEIDARFL